MLVMCALIRDRCNVQADTSVNRTPDGLRIDSWKTCRGNNDHHVLAILEPTVPRLLLANIDRLAHETKDNSALTLNEQDAALRLQARNCHSNL